MALNKFDMNLASTSPMLAPYVCMALRDTTCDRLSNLTDVDIVSLERKDLKSVSHASDVCSVFAAYRLLDIIYALENPDGPVRAPDHHCLKVNLGSFKVSQPSGM